MPGLNAFQQLGVSIHSRRLSREIRQGPGGAGIAEWVSIHSRRLSREILGLRRQIHEALNGFNPLPAVKPGDT